ncbi:MAG: replicative DNA helicase [Victivallales bacterium]|nr:replicative DNA helicase [Victivallales bacterium]MBT7165831.1 replicative DNA helicase [Victivallales bacterium]MBT7299607.1 replicative DNA helicase [Victivallales bacterium]
MRMMDSPPSQNVSVLRLDGRRMPHNEEAEVAVLGSMMIDPKGAMDVAQSQLAEVGPKVDAAGKRNAFYNPAHQLIFAALLQAADGAQEQPDVVTLADLLERQGELEAAGGRAYLAQVANSVPSAANIEQYAEIVRQNAVLRALISTGIDLVDSCFEPVDDVGVLADQVEQEIMSLNSAKDRSGLLTIRELMSPAIKYINDLWVGKDQARGLSTGLSTVDKLITGLRPAEMFVLAARPSIGKTALALNMAAHIAMCERAVPVGFFSLEMPARMLVIRLICSEARIGLTEIRDGALTDGNWRKIGDAGKRIGDSNIVIDDTGGLSILELRHRARQMKREYDIQVLFIDYLQLLTADAGRNSNRENQVAMMSGSIKALAKELNIPIVVLAQLNRQAEQQGQKPKLGNLRESGAIEQDADVVALLHRNREDQYSSDNIRKGVEAELIIAKNRNGETGIAPLTFLPAYMRFADRSRVADEDVPTGAI